VVSNEEIPAKPLKIVSADYDTVCIQNSEGKQITFSILPEAKIDEVIEKVKQANIPLSNEELIDIFPLAALPPQKVAKDYKSVFVDKNRTSRILTEQETRKRYGVSVSEYDRMKKHAQKVLFTSFYRRLVNPNV